ncbi:unnamed protein product [Linum tenue]|uniref:CCHC-type domain-containing protein n=1 Tax=Linum tenue TaxID=586396 RepID=A0AAV0RQ83_9ROSI|nr:unnamed protein product [Linum tenue]
MSRKVVALFRRSADPMLRTAAKKRWLEDARDGELAMMKTGLDQSGKPRLEDGDRIRGPGNGFVLPMVKFGPGCRRISGQPVEAWSRSGGRQAEPTLGDENYGFELTWSSWRRIRCTRIASSLSLVCLAPPTKQVVKLQQETMAEQNICQDQIVEFFTEDVVVSMQRAKMSLLGRLFIENRPSLSVIHKIVTSAWECRKKVQVMEAEMGLLQFLFDDTEDMEWVLKRTPWPVKDRVLHLQRWAPVTEEVFDSLGFAPFWVQMWGIPSHCRTIAFGRRVAETKLGEVLDVGLFGIKGESDQFVKARVKVNVLQPLRSQIWASNEVAGKFWVTFAYEFLPLFCFHCGRLGHMERNCVFPDPAGDERFGQEMATTEVGYRLKEETLKPAQYNYPPLPQSVWVNPKTKGQVANASATAREEKRKADAKSTEREVVLALPADGDRAVRGVQGAGIREGNRQGGSAGTQKGGRGSRVEETGPRSKQVREPAGLSAGTRGKQTAAGGGRPELGLKGRGEGGKPGGKGNARKEEEVPAGRGSEQGQEKGSGARGNAGMEGQMAGGLNAAEGKGAKKKAKSPGLEINGAGKVGEQVSVEGAQKPNGEQVEVEPEVKEAGGSSEMLGVAPTESLCSSSPCSGGCGSLAIGLSSMDASIRGWS